MMFSKGKTLLKIAHFARNRIHNPEILQFVGGVIILQNQNLNSVRGVLKFYAGGAIRPRGVLKF